MSNCTSKYTRLTDLEKSKIIRLYRENEISVVELAKRFGASRATIQKIVKGEE